MPNQHIQVIDTGVNDKIYIIGDVHGNIHAFRQVIESIEPHATLIIAGDIGDRGTDLTCPYKVPTSAEVYEELVSVSSDRCKILAVQGNHEVNLKKVKIILDKSKSERLAKRELFSNILETYIQGGLGWIFKESTIGKTKHLHWSFYHFSMGTDSQKKAYKPVVLSFIDLLLSADDCNDFVISRFNVYYDFVQQLPYVIKINSLYKPGWVVHADLAFTDEMLETKIKTNQLFTSDEISHLVKARSHQFSAIRNGCSTPVYCGHNTIGCKSRGNASNLAIREETNHINLDNGAFFRDVFLLLNHTDGTITQTGNTINETVMESAIAIQKHLNKSQRLAQLKRKRDVIDEQSFSALLPTDSLLSADKTLNPSMDKVFENDASTISI